MFKNDSGKSAERLAVIATTTDEEKLLGTPELPMSTGIEISSAVFDILIDWGLDTKVEFLYLTLLRPILGE